jgi:hypothetical protein
MRLVTYRPGEEHFFADEIAEPSARSLDIEEQFPPLQILRLQLEQARSRNDEENNPAQARDHSQIRLEQFCPAKSEKDDSEQVRRRSHHHVGETGDDRPKRPNEILSGPVR